MHRADDSSRIARRLPGAERQRLKCDFTDFTEAIVERPAPMAFRIGRFGGDVVRGMPVLCEIRGQTDELQLHGFERQFHGLLLGIAEPHAPALNDLGARMARSSHPDAPTIFS